MLSCNKDDDKPEPIIEEEPDLSFPECLLSDDIFEYQLIMSNPPSDPRGELLKKVYQGDTVYSFNQHILHDYDLVRYDNQCEIICRYVWNGPGTDCIGNPADSEFIGTVWTDPR
ncbi:hypothetical protein ACFSSB_15705 [Lacinutrix gracilariae]|uniref:Uncharacterized protein n=1 Tax=Lacinutrix gracilariae TaxID=1747198 RepID=A0ABW5K4D0_9FLAO